MHLKRFRRETVQDALRAAREELGPGALVLSTRMVAAPGLRGWLGARYAEVTAAAERPKVSDLRHLIADDLADEPWSGTNIMTSDDDVLDRAQAVRQAAAFAKAALRAEAADKGRRGSAKTAAVKPRAAARKTKKAEEVPSERAVASLAAQLQATGLDAAFAREVAAAHPTTRRRGATVHNLRTTLANQLAPLAATDDSYAPVEVFVGPPGVGKTTTIAKIASQERARRGARLGLVAADGFRVGAVEQLRLYADVLSAPLAVARTPDELEAAIAGATPRRALLVDTAGRSPNDAASREMLQVLGNHAGVRTHIVVAASTPASTLRRVLDRFEDAQPSRIVITKLDEAESLAPLVSVLRDRKLPISYLGTGQGVPEDLERATPQALAAWVAGDAAEGATA